MDTSEFNKGAGREKYWVELADGEKMERMHHVVRSLQAQLRELEGQINNLNVHNHAVDGHPSVPLMRGGGNYALGTGPEGTEVWF